jgi:hypothetical protein
MRPDDLARELGVSGKTIRAWLRERYPRSADERHAPWHLTTAQERALRARFAGRPKRAETREDMVVTTIALPEPLHARLSRVARRESLALTEAVRQAVAEWLSRRAGSK